MKLLNKITGLLVIILALTSCEDWKYDANVEAPGVSITVDNPNAAVNDTVYITVSSDAQYLAYYKGVLENEFEQSRTYALWKNGIDAFYDSTYRIPVTENVTEREWFFYEYNSVSDIEAAGISFNNCTAELGEFEQPSTAYMKVNNKKQLHLNIPRNDQPSQLIISPTDTYIGKNEYDIPGQSIALELYYVSDEEDASLRETSGIIGQCELKVTYVMKDGQEFSHDDRGATKDNIDINFRTKNPLLYPTGSGTFGADKNIFKKMVDEQIDKVILQFGSGEGIVGGDTTKYYGFSGDVYIVSMRLGGTHYYEWDEGQNLYSNYVGTQTSEHKVKLVYDTPGTYDFWVVGTNVGRKVYTDENNYQNQFGFSSKDYDIKRTYIMETITIN